MGPHGSAMVVAVGVPLVGAVIDASVPAWGAAATGLLGALIALAALPTGLGHRRSAAHTSLPRLNRPGPPPSARPSRPRTRRRLARSPVSDVAADHRAPSAPGAADSLRGGRQAAVVAQAPRRFDRRGQGPSQAGGLASAQAA